MLQNRYLRFSLPLIGILLMLLIVCAANSYAAAPPDATYVGTTKCQLCHAGMSAPIISGWKKTAHSRSFADVSKSPNAIVATFAADAPIKKEQIKYVLASGRTHQAYIGADFKTLPAEWNTVSKKWETTTSLDAKTQCIGCHVTGYKTTDNTWTDPFVGCESCHGPGSAHATSGNKALILNPSSLPADRNMMVCGQCHARGTDPTKALSFPVGYRPGDDLTKSFILAAVAGCAQNQQYNELLTSKHAAAGTICTTCHEPHGAGTTQPAQLRKPVNDLCLGCHKNITQDKNHPQIPTGSTCATCHMPSGSHAFKVPTPQS